MATTSNTISAAVAEAVSAACSGIWINSYEHMDAVAEILEMCRKRRWGVLLWDPEQGLRKPGAPAPDDPILSPVAALQELQKATDAPTERILLIMRNIHPFVAGPDGRVMQPNVLQALQRAVETGASTGRHVIVLSYDHVRIPTELEKLFYLIEHPLPQRDEIYALWGTVEGDEDHPLPAKESPEAARIFDAVTGLTRQEIVTAMSILLTRKGRLIPADLWEMKGRMLLKTGALELLTAAQLEKNFEPTGFSQLGGLNALKEFCLQMFNSPRLSDKIRPLGITLVGPPGGGKTAFAKALGQEIGWPTVRLDVGALLGSYVGETEANTRRILRTVDAMAPVVLMIDEVEKALAGTSGQHDSGVGARLMGAILTWMNDRRARVFTVFTANDVTRLPPELFRAERIDGLFMLDIPGREQKDMIWDIYTKMFELTREQVQERPDDTDWMPAEIKTCCRQAALRNISLVEAAAQVVPTCKVNAERVAALRQWAHNRCLSAEYRGLYNKDSPNKQPLRPEDISTTARPRRRVAKKGDEDKHDNGNDNGGGPAVPPSPLVN